MVCSVGNGRMATMARLLAAGNLPQTIAEETGHRKLAAQYIQRELREADEANLLNEEDMHVFGLKPMTDPLHLVCCNACKRPVKASQYAAHAELCKLLSYTEETLSERDGGTGHKKPPRKERKKLLTSHTNQATTVGERERSKSINPNDIVASDSHLNDRIGMTSSSLDEKDGKFPKGGSGKPYDHVGHQKTEQIHGLCLPTTDVPAPLATKIYYSQSHHRFRSALSHLFYEASAKEHCSDLVSSKVLQETMMLSQASSKDSSQELMVDHPEQKRETHAFPSVPNPYQNFAQSSELCLAKSGGCPPALNFSDQFLANNVLRSHTASPGMMKNKYLSKPYSFAGNSGTIQQPDGSVPVI